MNEMTDESGPELDDRLGGLLTAAAPSGDDDPPSGPRNCR